MCAYIWCVHACICVLRHLHSILWALLVIIWVGGGGIWGELVLSFHGDGYITALKIPKKQDDVLNHRALLLCKQSTICLHLYNNYWDFNHQIQAWPDDTIQAADLLVGAYSLVFAGEVLHAGCSTVSGLQRECWILRACNWTSLSCRCWKGWGKYQNHTHEDRQVGQLCSLCVWCFAFQHMWVPHHQTSSELLCFYARV